MAVCIFTWFVDILRLGMEAKLAAGSDASCWKFKMDNEFGRNARYHTKSITLGNPNGQDKYLGGNQREADRA